MSVIAINRGRKEEGTTNAVLYNDPSAGLVINIASKADPDLMALLERTVWGHRGARFKSLGIANRLSGLEDPAFITLKRDGELVGGYCFSRRTLRMSGTPIKALYRTGFTINESHAARGYGRLLAQVSKSYFERQEPELSLSYGLVESRNLRCLNALEAAGYESMGSVESLIFSRVRPQPKARAIRLDAGQATDWRNELCGLYGDHSLVRFTDSARQGGYFLSQEAGELRAGVHACVGHMSVKGYRSWPRFLLPESRRFLLFEAIYCPPGHTKSLFQLMESLLYKYQVRYGAFFLDRGSALFSRLKNHRGLGRLDRFCRPEPIQIMAAGEGLEDNKRPFYIAASDLI